MPQCRWSELYALSKHAPFALVNNALQLIGCLSDALAELHKLAEVLLITGQHCKQGGPPDPVAEAAATTGTGDHTTITLEGALAKDVDDTTATSKRDMTATAAAATAPSATEERAVQLAAAASHHLQQVPQLLPATRKERYVGRLGSHR